MPFEVGPTVQDSNKEAAEQCTMAPAHTAAKLHSGTQYYTLRLTRLNCHYKHAVQLSPPGTDRVGPTEDDGFLTERLFLYPENYPCSL